jgi:EpsI family protein
LKNLSPEQPTQSSQRRQQPDFIMATAPSPSVSASTDQRLLKRSLWLFGFLALAAVLGQLAVPRLVNEAGPRANLEAVVPTSFGAWRLDPNVVPLMPSPDQVALLGEIYDETLARTYVNTRGERVMLSLAYGRNQSRRFQIHKPEVCYVGQGFKLTEMRTGQLQARQHVVPVMELVAVQGPRVEPITYWIRVGDELGRGWVEQNKIRAKYALRGQIPDGLLFRMSSISRGDTAKDFELQRRFADELMAAVSDAKLVALMGDVNKLQLAAR